MMELKEKIDKSIIIDGDINTPLSTIEPDRKYTGERRNQRKDLTGTYRALCAMTSVHGTCNKIDHILGHKTNLNKFTMIEIT